MLKDKFPTRKDGLPVGRMLTLTDGRIYLNPPEAIIDGKTGERKRVTENPRHPCVPQEAGLVCHKRCPICGIIK